MSNAPQSLGSIYSEVGFKYNPTGFQQYEAALKRAEQMAQAFAQGQKQATQAQQAHTTASRGATDQAELLHRAQLRVNLAMADSAGKIRILRDELARHTAGSLDYLRVQERLIQAENRAARGLGPALPRTVAGFTGAGLAQAAGVAAGAVGIPFGVGAVVDFTRSSVELRASLDESRRSLGVFLGDLERGNRTFERAAEFGRRYGFTQREMADSLRALGPLLRTSTADIERQLNVTARLAALAPEQGFGGAAFAIRELQSGDVQSIADRFNIGRAAAHALVQEVQSGRDVFDALDGLLTKLGATNAILEQRTQGVAGEMRNFRVAQEDLSRAVGEFAEGPGTRVLDWLNQAIRGFLDLTEAAKKPRLEAPDTPDTPDIGGDLLSTDVSRNIRGLRELLHLFNDPSFATLRGVLFGTADALGGVTAATQNSTAGADAYRQAIDSNIRAQQVYQAELDKTAAAAGGLKNTLGDLEDAHERAARAAKHEGEAEFEILKAQQDALKENSKRLADTLIADDRAIAKAQRSLAEDIEEATKSHNDRVEHLRSQGRIQALQDAQSRREAQADELSGTAGFYRQLFDLTRGSFGQAARGEALKQLRAAQAEAAELEKTDPAAAARLLQARTGQILGGIQQQQQNAALLRDARRGGPLTQQQAKEEINVITGITNQANEAQIKAIKGGAKTRQDVQGEQIKELLRGTGKSIKDVGDLTGAELAAEDKGFAESLKKRNKAFTDFTEDLKTDVRRQLENLALTPDEQRRKALDGPIWARLGADFGKTMVAQIQVQLSNARLVPPQTPGVSAPGTSPTTTVPSNVNPALAASDPRLIPQAAQIVVPGGVERDTFHDIRTNPTTGQKEYHQGLDIAANEGTPIRFPSRSGKVYKVGSSSQYGNNVQILDEQGRLWYFGHIQRALVKEGDLVSYGQAVALVGHTGVAGIGNHVHVQLRPNLTGAPIDPTDILNEIARNPSLVIPSDASDRQPVPPAPRAPMPNPADATNPNLNPNPPLPEPGPGSTVGHQFMGQSFGGYTPLLLRQPQTQALAGGGAAGMNLTVNIDLRGATGYDATIERRIEQAVQRGVEQYEYGLQQSVQRLGTQGPLQS